MSDKIRLNLQVSAELNAIIEEIAENASTTRTDVIRQALALTKAAHNLNTNGVNAVNERTIWKFPLRVTDEQAIEMPAGAVVLHVAEQAGTVCLWANVDTRAPKELRTFRIYGTGHPMPASPGRHLGTFMLREGALVFHAFDPSPWKGCT